jgi:hypothetical protein
MTEVEVNSIAEAIGDTALQDMHMEVVEQDPKTHTFYVKCRYDGPTIKHGQRLILHGMRLWIKCPYDDWAGLSKALKKA